MIPRVPLRTALSDPQLLGNCLPGDSWRPWRTLLIGAMGEALDAEETELFKSLTGGREPPSDGRPVEEFVGIVGRRGGKSRAISVLVTYVAALCTHPSLVRGERGVALVCSVDQRASDVILDYTEANFLQSPVLCQLIEQRVQRVLRLNNGIDVEIRSSDFRKIRGPTLVFACCDELAFLMTDESSVTPDSAVLAAIRPGLATTGGMLALISSPYARRGELFRAYERFFGHAGDPGILVAQGPSRTFNPALPQSVVDRAYERDPESASAEYGGLFRSDLKSYISREALAAVTATGVLERPRQDGTGYSAFCDPAGGSGADSMTLAVGFMDQNRETAVLSCLREIRPPFSPEAVALEFAAVLKSYGLTSCVGDKFGGLWVAEQFSRAGILYEAVAEPKSLLYGSLLAAINSKRVDLLDHPRLSSQLLTLERRTSKTGRGDVIDHQPNCHDDVCNSAAGCLATILARGVYNISVLAGTTTDDPLGIEFYRRARNAAYLMSGGMIRLF